MNNKVNKTLDELSLLVWLTKGRKYELIPTLCNYTGCTEEDYSDSVLIRIVEDALSDISRKYHLPGIMWSYFDARRTHKNYSEVFNKPYDESAVLVAPFLHIPTYTFDMEDLKKLNELKKYLPEYNKNAKK